MSVTDRLLANSRAYAEAFASRPPATTERRVAVVARIHASPFIPRKESVRGFVYEVESGRLREVSERAGEVMLRGTAEGATAGLTPRPASGTLRRAPSRR